MKKAFTAFHNAADTALDSAAPYLGDDPSTRYRKDKHNNGNSRQTTLDGGGLLWTHQNSAAHHHLASMGDLDPSVNRYHRNAKSQSANSLRAVFYASPLETVQEKSKGTTTTVSCTVSSADPTSTMMSSVLRHHKVPALSMLSHCTRSHGGLSKNGRHHVHGQHDVGKFE